MPEPQTTDPPQDEAQVRTADQQRRLREAVKLLLAGYQAWLAKQTPAKE